MTLLPLMTLPDRVHGPAKLVAVHIPIPYNVENRKYLPSARLTTAGSCVKQSPEQPNGFVYAWTTAVMQANEAASTLNVNFMLRMGEPCKPTSAYIHS